MSEGVVFKREQMALVHGVVEHDCRYQKQLQQQQQQQHQQQ
jgi:hypothetical protein